MAFFPAASRCLLLSLCVFLAKESTAQCQSPPPPVAPIGPFGPLGTHVPPGPIELIVLGPAPSVDILGPLGGDLIPQSPSALELSIADLVPACPATGATLTHVSSIASPVQVSVKPPSGACIPGSSVEVVEPLFTVETAQCGCTVVKLYWIHEIITLCPLGTGRWAKTKVLGEAELVHEWVIHNTHDIKPNPQALSPCPCHGPY